MTDSFLQELSKPRPDPGGGSAAAYGASLGLALVEKICLIELGRTNAGSHAHAYWEEIHARVVEPSHALRRLRDDDVEAYRRLAETRRKGSVGSQQVISAAALQAIVPPIRIMEQCVRALVYASETSVRCRRHLVPDLQVACEFLAAAIRGAYAIALANVHLVEDLQTRSDWLRQLGRLMDDSERQIRVVKAEIASRAEPVLPDPDDCLREER